MKLFFFSDLHIESKATKRQASKFESRKKVDPREKLRACGLDPDTYELWTDKKYKPQISVDDFRDLTPQLIESINKREANLVVGIGDIFDIGSSKGRDTARHKEVTEAFSSFLDGTDAPAILQIGNADVDLFEPLTLPIREMQSLSTVSGSTEDEFGNQLLTLNDFIIVGINSVSVAEYGLPRFEARNREFLEKALNSASRKPLIVFTHHPPFEVIPKSRILEEKTGQSYISQEWIVNLVKQY